MTLFNWLNYLNNYVLKTILVLEHSPALITGHKNLFSEGKFAYCKMLIFGWCNVSEDIFICFPELTGYLDKFLKNYVIMLLNIYT